MNSGTCPKCQSKEIYTNLKKTPKHIIPLSTFGKAKITHYVCSSCGFTEMYFAREYLEKVKDSWDKV